MIPIDRSGFVAPADWSTKVRSKLPPAFWAEIVRFEALPLRSRRSGFKTFAPHALPMVKAEREFPPLWRTVKAVQTAVKALSNGRCAWCQIDATASHHGHVDHVEPKSLVPSKAYDVANYLFGCFICNNTKGDRWPDRGGYVRPDVGDPRLRFRFTTTGRMIANRGDTEAKATVKDIGLNRADLVTRRKQAIQATLKPLRAALRDAAKRGLSAAQARKLARPFLVEDDAAFSAAVNQCVRREWGRWFEAPL